MSSIVVKNSVTNAEYSVLLADTVIPSIDGLLDADAHYLLDHSGIQGLQGLDGKSYIVELESTNGTIFRVGESQNTWIHAHVILNGVEITDQVATNRFIWRRVSRIPDPGGDAAWNLHQLLYPSKSIYLTVASILYTATFHCDIIQ